MGSFGGATGNGSDPAVSSEMRSAADSVDTRVRIFDGSRRRKYTSVAALRRIIRADNSRVAELPNPAQATPELRQTNGYLVENDRRLAELEEHLDELIRRAASVASELSKSAQTPTKDARSPEKKKARASAKPGKSSTKTPRSSAKRTAGSSTTSRDATEAEETSGDGLPVAPEPGEGGLTVEP